MFALVSKNTAAKRSVRPTDFDFDAMRQAHIEDVIDDARYPDRVERTLAMRGDAHDTLFPPVARLRRMGFDLEALSGLIAYGCIDGVKIGQLVKAVEDEPEILETVNQGLRNRRPLSDGNGKVMTMDEVADIGFDTELVLACRGQALTDTQLLDLCYHVKRGWTSLEDAVCGLSYFADEVRAAARKSSGKACRLAA